MLLFYNVERTITDPNENYSNIISIVSLRKIIMNSSVTTLFSKSSLVGLVSSVLFLAGTSANAQSVEERAAELDRRAAELDARESALASRGGAGFSGGGDLLPPSANPGECYARVWVDAQYTERQEQVLAREAGSKINIIPARYETVNETIEVSAASSRLETIPAVYGTETETIKIRDGQRSWRTANSIDSTPASQALLAAAQAHGINLDDASVGSCFYEHHVAETYRTETEQVLTKAADETVSLIPAEYTTVEETVLVQEASSRLVTVPAEYEQVQEQIVDKPAHTIWKRGTGPIQRINEATGEIMCLVEIPATYKTITRSVLKTPAQTRTEEIPAQYKTVKVRKLVSAASEQRTPIPAVFSTVDRRVIDQPAGFVWQGAAASDQHPKSTRTGNQICLTQSEPQYKTVERTVVQTPAQTRSIDIPAEFRTVEVTKLVEPAREEVTEIPAEYRSVTKRELVKDGYMAWRSILCETNMTAGRISSIQSALISAGYDIGPGGPDGVIGADTIKAVNEFQRANNLPVDKYLNIETVKALGVSIQ